MNGDSKNQKDIPMSQLISESSLAADELSRHTNEQFPPGEQPHEKEIDLNELFPDSETNLNELFPDAEVKHLLKSITKNKKDMNLIKERLTNENETSDENKEGELADDDLSESS